MDELHQVQYIAPDLNPIHALVKSDRCCIVIQNYNKRKLLTFKKKKKRTSEYVCLNKNLSCPLIVRGDNLRKICSSQGMSFQI